MEQSSERNAQKTILVVDDTSEVLEFIALVLKRGNLNLLFVCMLSISAAAQSPKTPTFDPRLPFASIIREDLFAGFMAGGNDTDNQRFLRGEMNLEILLAERPGDKAGLTAWKGGIAFKRAIEAYETKHTDDFEREYRKALDLYSEAARLDPADVGVMAITGGGFALFADRLPERYRSGAWDAAYRAYNGVWRVQRADVDKLPLHFKGELLAGMAQSAQRSNHAAESAQFLDKLVTTMPGTPYAAMAKKWIDSPEISAKTNLTCKTCHEAGRLEARKASLPESK